MDDDDDDDDDDDGDFGDFGDGDGVVYYLCPPCWNWTKHDRSIFKYPPEEPGPVLMTALLEIPILIGSWGWNNIIYIYIYSIVLIL